MRYIKYRMERWKHFAVQLGDQIDRVRPSKLYNNICTEDDEDLCDDEGSDLKILYLFENLNKQARGWRIILSVSRKS